MKYLTLIAAFFVSVFVANAARAEIQTVPYVDPGKYLGDWYEISHIPQPFEFGNCACARQRLGPVKQAQIISVYNSCNKNSANGEFTDITGTATNDDPQSNSKWTVDFKLPWKGTYWIIGLDQDYRYAVVTNKEGNALYILSKTPTLEKALYDEAVATAVKQNIDTSKLVMTDHFGCTYPN